MNKKELTYKIICMMQESIDDPVGWTPEQEKILKKLIKELEEMGDALREVRDYKLNNI